MRVDANACDGMRSHNLRRSGRSLPYGTEPQREAEANERGAAAPSPRLENLGGPPRGKRADPRKASAQGR